ncbi:MAG: methionyl-tRNA formyltransferase [Clostridia bacterium]|nr:methionyl-tRNA formyltransferase [Clostridia bacterium]
MAQIDVTKIEKIDKERVTIHEKVYTTYSVFDDCGKHFVQIDTYGRSDRELPGKISQSIQLDESSAKYLFDLLKKEYNF